MEITHVPNDYQAEVSLLGCIFLDNNTLTIISDGVSVDDFYDSRNRTLYRMMLKLSSNNHKIDPMTVISVLNENNLLETVGGVDYLSSIAEFEYSTANIDSYIRIIKEASIRRHAIDVLGELQKKGYDETTPAFDYLNEVERVIFELSRKNDVSKFIPINDVTKEVLEVTERNSKNKNEVIGLDTGFGGLNKYTQGFQPGQLLILAARPAMGKSAMAMNLAINIATCNKNSQATVAVFNLEMSAGQLVERMIASDSSIRLNQIKSGNLSQLEWVRFTTACNKLNMLELYFDDSSDSTIASIRAKCRKLKSEVGLDFVVIDYLQLIEGDNPKASQQERISKISRSLKLMARELEIPVLALSQLSRSVEQREDKRPIMSDLRDSGSIEQDADIVMFLYRDDYYNKGSERKGEADLIISKNRSGSVNNDGLPYLFAGEYQRFKEKKEE